MRVLIVGILVLALAVAGVSTYLIQTFSGEENIEELQKEAQKPKIRVLVATRDLVRGDSVNADSLTWQVWVEEALNPKFVAVETDEQQAERIKDFIGGVVRHQISDGEPILASKILKKEDAGFLSGVLEMGKRAVTFKASPISASGGFVLPGDRVDVLLTHAKVSEALRKKEAGKKKNPDEPLTVLSQTTETIMRDVVVLAVGPLMAAPKEGAAAAGNITLEVTPKQAELLITARTMGVISLVLRSLQTDPGESDGPSFTTDVEVSPLISNINAILKARREGRTEALQKQLQRLESEKENLEKAVQEGKPGPKAAAAPAPKDVITIYRGGKDPQEVTVK